MTTACPPTEALGGLLRGDLPAGRAAALREHLEGCGSCVDALDRLTDDPQLERWMADAPGDSARRLALGGLRPCMTATTPEAIGPYLIEAEIGRGGMGVVYRAREAATGRVVALKVLRPDTADERARARFGLELRAAAQLEHDHIVRVYAASDPSEPILYFAMEYLAGPSLAGRLRRDGRLDPRLAADLVSQAAAGLAAAHAAGLVHRDVKPENILIDPASGRAKLGDFGLARPAASRSGLTTEGAVVGTPAYLSPEQARGDEDAGPSADIYALGVALYECLAGELPFRGAPHRVIHQVLDDEPRPPRSLNDAIPRDLETICLKAMSKEPRRRYASAADLGDDLRRFLRGEPIRARTLGPAARLARFARRKPLAAALALSLVAGSATTAILWRRAEANAALARARLAESDRSFRQARDAVDGLYVKLYLGGALNKPGLESTRAEILREILAYYRDFIARRGADPTLRADVAEASLRVGLLTTAIGDRRDALAALRQARPLLEALVRARPADREVRRKLAQCHDQIGFMLQQLGRFPEALDAHRKACEVHRELVASDPTSRQWRQLAGHGFGNLANTYCVAGNPAEARRAYERAREQQEGLVRLEPSNISYRNDLAMTLNNMAVREESPERAMRLLGEALALRRGMAAERPGDPYLRRNVARTLFNMASRRGLCGEYAEALPLYDESCEMLRAVNREVVYHVGFRGELCTALNLRAETLARLGRREEAMKALEESRGVLNDVLRADPQNPAFRSYRAQVLAINAAICEQAGRLEEALEAQGGRIAILEQLAADLPDQGEFAAARDDASKAIGSLRARIRREAAARE